MAFSLMRRPSALLRHVFSTDLRGLFDELDREVLPGPQGFLPPVDVYHDEDKVTVRAEVPGVKKEDLDVHVEGDLLTMSGKKEHVESRNYHQMETRCGSFRRLIALPHTVDAEKIAAVYRDGVLELTLPLKAEAKPRQITVDVA